MFRFIMDKFSIILIVSLLTQTTYAIDDSKLSRPGSENSVSSMDTEWSEVDPDKVFCDDDVSSVWSELKRSCLRHKEEFLIVGTVAATGILYYLMYGVKPADEYYYDGYSWR